MSDTCGEKVIREDVRSIFAATGRLPKLVYILGKADADAIVRGSIVANARFRLSTNGGMVEVRIDVRVQDGRVHRAYECGCGALFVDDRCRSGKCAACMSEASLALNARKPTP